MDKGYVYNKTNDIFPGDKVVIPEGSICVRIVHELLSDGQPITDTFVEWLEPVKD